MYLLMVQLLDERYRHSLASSFLMLCFNFVCPNSKSTILQVCFSLQTLDRFKHKFTCIYFVLTFKCKNIIHNNMKKTANL